MVEYVARKKFQLRRKCHFEEEDEILNKNLNESLPDLKWSNYKLEITKNPPALFRAMSINLYCLKTSIAPISEITNRFIEKKIKAKSINRTD